MIVPVSSLHHHPFNAEIYTLSDLNTLTNSINEVGLLEPLVINKKNEVISGNRRLEAVRKLKIGDVDDVEECKGEGYLLNFKSLEKMNKE